MENRRTRESFTKTLKRICKRIESQQVYETEWKFELLNEIVHCRFKIKTLWVAGSYARGASFCGDLDLIADLDIEKGSLPMLNKVSRLISGNAPDVRIIVGTPDESMAKYKFPEAKLIWSHDAPDWEAAINAIPEDPTASHFPRRYDVLPLRREQYSMGGDENRLEKFIDLLEADVISSKWIPISEIKVQPENWSSDASKYFEKIQSACGRKTCELMPFIIEWFRDNNICDQWKYEYGEKSHFKIGGADVIVGHPFLDYELLNNVICSSVVIAPHLSRRGPNGLWVLTRGEKHPLGGQFSNCGAFFIKDENRPAIIQYIDDWKEALSLDLFVDRKHAQKERREMMRDYDGKLEICQATSKDLLTLLSYPDMVNIEGECLCLTRKGRWFDCGDELASIEKITSMFAPRITVNETARRMVKNG